MYLPDAKIIWNGNTVSPNPIALSPFLDTLPLSRHDLQSLDCHPMPGMSLFHCRGNTNEIRDEIDK
jgi:NTF2-related export protein 1/2